MLCLAVLFVLLLLLGVSVVVGTIGRWLKQPGDRVARDEPLVEIQTDKVNAEVPSPAAGVLREILVPEGTTVPVKTDLAVLTSDAPTTAAPVTEPAAPPSPVGPSPRTDGSAATPKDRKRFYTPVVLRIARERNLDLESIAGTGLGGRVTRRDVEAALQAQPAESIPVQSPSPTSDGVAQPLSPMRRAIAEHLSRARSDIPDAWTMVEVDATRLVRRRAAMADGWQAREGYELTYFPFFVEAVIEGLRVVPELNASWDENGIRVHHGIHLGIAVSVQQGLVVPVLRDADQLSVTGLAARLHDLVQRSRAGKLTADDLQGATFTVNNPGVFGSVLSQPIVPLGQAGIVTMEAIVKRAVVTDDDAIAIRSMMNCCLSFDHRILDGAGALRFLNTVKHHLEGLPV